MSVHDAIQRAVDGRRIAREDHAAAITRMVDEIEQRYAADRLDVPPDEIHTHTTQEHAHDGHTG